MSKPDAKELREWFVREMSKGTQGEVYISPKQYDELVKLGLIKKKGRKSENHK